MAARRMPSSSLVRSRAARQARRQRSSSGITRSLQIMVESAMVSTMTMPVAAESPPMKTSSASAWLSGPSAGEHEGVGVDVRREVQQPAKAIGSTKTLIASR